MLFLYWSIIYVRCRLLILKFHSLLKFCQVSRQIVRVCCNCSPQTIPTDCHTFSLAQAVLFVQGSNFFSLVLLVMRMLLIQLIQQFTERTILGGLKHALNQISICLEHGEAQVTQYDWIVCINLRIVPQLCHYISAIEYVSLLDQASIAFHYFLVAESD